MSAGDELDGFPAALRERYRPRALLGEGSYGVVFRAEDSALLRDVAVKVFRTMLGEEQRGRFLREVRALGAVEHPHVVSIFDADATPEGAWIVMELLSGAPADEAAPADPEALMLDVAAGLQAIHDQGLLHRDIKPANLFVTEEGRGVLLDLGLVADPAATAVTATGNIVGTLRYLAPELFRGAPASPAADWYAWGASLFELVEGRPLRDRVPVERLMAGLEIPPPEYQRIRSGTGLARLVRACVDPDPAERPEDLEALLALRDAPPKPARSPAPRAPGRPGRGRLALALGAAAGVLLLGYAGSGGPGPAPTPASAPEEDPGAAVVEAATRVRAALEKPDAVDPDPRQFFPRLRLLPGFADLLEVLRRVPDLTRLEPEARRALLALDEVLVARDRMPIFGAVVRPLPEDAEPTRLTVRRRGADEAEELSLTGWTAEALREAWAAEAVVEEGMRDLVERPREELEHVPTILALRLFGRPGPGTLFSLPGTPENVRYLGTMLRPGAPHTHRALVAARRALEEVEGERREARMHLMRRILAKQDVNMLCELASLPPWLLFGGEPRTPVGWFLVGRMAAVQALIYLEAGADAAEPEAYARAALRRARREDGPLPGGYRGQVATQEFLKFLVRIGDWDTVIQEIGRLRAPLRDRPEEFTGFLLQELGQAMMVLVKDGELPRGELDALESALGIWRERHPDVPAHDAPVELHRDVRAELAKPPR